jgi:tetratricopeptide (TPR) repeat protein
MDNSLAAVYLGILLILLGILAGFIFRQVMRNRRMEATINRLQPKLNKATGTTQEHFELGSIYLSKKLPAQAIAQFQKALKSATTDQEDLPGTEPEVNIAPIYNALGYAYFAQEQYDLAIRNYKEALSQQSDYITALNNLGHAYERKKLERQALEAYEQVLTTAPKNKTANRRANVLRRRLTSLS